MVNIQHDEQKHKFYVELDGAEAHLKYSILENEDLDFYSTFVPPEGRGQGIAKKLVDAGVEYAKNNDKRIKPTCSYVVKYFNDHPELTSLNRG